MTCVSATGGTLNPPRYDWDLPRKRALTRCKACGSGFPTALILSAHGWTWDQHARVCPKRPLDVALANLRRFAETPPAEYIIDQELAHVAKLIAAARQPGKRHDHAARLECIGPLPEPLHAHEIT